MTRSIFATIVAAVFLLAFGSCDGTDGGKSAFVAVDASGWAYADALEMRFGGDMASLQSDSSGIDSVAEGLLCITVRHSDDYRYRNLWLELSCRVADTIMQRDTFNIILADTYGHWRGSGSGPSIQLTDTVSRSYRMHYGHPLVLRHIMRPDTIGHIERVGIHFIPVDNE